eukprot:33270_1
MGAKRRKKTKLGKHDNVKRRKKKDNINISLDHFNQDGYILLRQNKIFYRHDGAIRVLFSILNEHNRRPTISFYDVLPDNTLISFHRIPDDFNINAYSNSIVQTLNMKLNGIWRITQNIKNVVHEHQILDISMYRMSGDKCQKRVQCHRNIWCKSIGTIVAISNIFDDRNQALISFGNWGYINQNAQAECIVIKLINCEYAVHTSLPLDYRSTNSHYTFDSVIPYRSCWLFDFNDKGRYPFITPRMAYRMFECGIEMIARLNGSKSYSDWCDEGFPDCCEPYLKKPFWKQSFIVALERVLVRLKHGMDFKCNCTAEQMAVHKLIHEIQEWEDFNSDYPSDFVDDAYDLLPNYGVRDTKWCDLQDAGLIDHDVLMLFDPKIKKSILNPNSTVCLLWDFRNLHPSTWFVSFRDNEFNPCFIQNPLNEATIWMYVCEKIEAIVCQLTWSHWGRSTFIKKIWSSFEMFDFDTCISFMLQQHKSLVSMAFNRKVQVTHEMLDELNQNIKNVQYLDKTAAVSMIILVLIIFYRVKDAHHFEYLRIHLQLYEWLCNDYYLHLFRNSWNSHDKCFVFPFYCILLSIMTNELYYYDDPSIENEEYVMHILEKISFEYMFRKHTSARVSYRTDEFRAVVTCCVNRKVSKSNFKHLARLVCKFRHQIKCFNGMCIKTTSSNIQTKLRLCDKCMIARYCSKKCQKKHWKAHKTFCALF